MIRVIVSFGLVIVIVFFSILLCSCTNNLKLGDNPVTLSDDSGGMIIAFAAKKGDSAYKVYIRSVTRDGNTNWERRIGNEYGWNSRCIALNRNASGDIFASWCVYVPKDGASIREYHLTKLSGTGDILWDKKGNNAEVLLEEAEMTPVSETTHDIVNDDKTVIEWSQDDNSVLYVQMLDKHGTPQWNDDGIRIAQLTYLNYSSDFKIVSDSYHNVYVVNYQ